jgi:glycosyltransferase involved in cell wall biosynthesis
VEKSLICFLVVGRMGKSLTFSKAEPFSMHQAIERIYIFRETEGFPLRKVTYITLPKWITGLKPVFLSKLLRVIAEPVQLIYFGLKLRPDIINGYHLIPKGLNSLLAARLTGSKCIISLIGGPVEVETYSKFKWVLKRFNLCALRKPDLITTKGTIVNSYLENHAISQTKIIIYNGSINLARFFYNPSTIKDIDLVFAGVFRELKGPDRVLKIVALLKKENPFIKACMLGNGKLYDSCLNMAEKLGISGNVVFEGYVDDPSHFFQRSKTIVMPSVSEGLPTAMLEAMACGCVPVVSDVGNISDIIHNGYNAYIVQDYRDTEKFAEYVAKLLGDNDLHSRIAENGMQTVKTNFSADKQMTVIDNILRVLYEGNEIH